VSAKRPNAKANTVNAFLIIRNAAQAASADHVATLRFESNTLQVITTFSEIKLNTFSKL